MSIENLHTNWQGEGVSKVKAANRGFLKNAMENHFQVHASTLRGNIFVKGCVKYGRGRSVLVARLLQMQDGLCTFWTGSGGRNVVQMGDQEFRTSHPPVSLSLSPPAAVRACGHKMRGMDFVRNTIEICPLFFSCQIGPNSEYCLLFQYLELKHLA